MDDPYLRSVRFEKAQFEALQIIAKRDGRPLNNLVRHILNIGLDWAYPDWEATILPNDPPENQMRLPGTESIT